MFISGLIVATLATQSSATLPFVSPIFSSHMVLQRDKANAIWGWTTPGSRVTISLADHKASATADPAGKWMAHIAPPPVGGPYTLKVDGLDHAQFDDVLVGDVWICSGQSNMEFGVGMVKNSQAEIAAANYPGIRLYMVPKTAAPLPISVTPGAWYECNSKNIAANGWGGFSAAAYFFARELNQRLKIPIGLVDTCWGGTPAESWVSQQGLTPFDDFKQTISNINLLIRPGEESTAQKLDKWARANDPGSTHGDDWAVPELDDSAWKPTARPMSGSAGLGRFQGVVWYRQEVILPDPVPFGVVQLQLGNARDMDSIWVNGTKAGEQYAPNQWRQYAVDSKLFKPGKNVIAARIVSSGGQGGMQGPYNIYLSDGTRISLNNGWKYMAGADLTKSAPLPLMFTGDPNVATVLYNSMIAPIVPLAIKGAIWYQGESNVGRGAQYQKLLPALIGDWRKSFGEGDFPFFVVQIANYGARHPQPVDDAWPELREAQALTAQRVRNTGLAVTIDIGEGGDIHPKDKQDVGLRLALSALHIAYGQNLPYSGPVYKSAHREGSTLHVSFDHADGGLKSGSDKLAGFQIAGSDHKFYWADAQIQGNEVVLSSASVPDPVSVRYAWDSDPEATLYNGAGLPAVPFRSGFGDSH